MDRRTFVKVLAGGLFAARATVTGAGQNAWAPGPPAVFPERQFAWNAVLKRDSHGNVQLPGHHFLAMLDVNGKAEKKKAMRLEEALSRLEGLFPRNADGVLFVLAWGPAYFRDVLGLSDSENPIPDPKRLSSFEIPKLDAYHACLHVTGNNLDIVEAVREALFEGKTTIKGKSVGLDLRAVFAPKEFRTGFSGAPFPSQHQNVSGIPPGEPIGRDKPLFMGFQSGFKGNQATEDEVAITQGYFKGGTTMHVSRIRLRLDDWYAHLSEQERVARMFSPYQSPEQVAGFKDNPPTDAERVTEAARRYGVAGHEQKTAEARLNGRPLILRRDFNTVDGGTAGLHFVALQRSIDNFIAVRQAMNGEKLPYENPSVKPRINNGILEFMFVLNRANFIVPPRSKRSFPLFEGKGA